MPPEPWFDDLNPKISEDTDLNYKIKNNGGKAYISSQIKVEYYARSSLFYFIKLCYNYGVGRGIFVMKNKTFLALRQIILPLAFLLLKVQILMSFLLNFIF